MKQMPERTIARDLPIRLQQLAFEKSAEALLDWLRANDPEHFMEASPHAHQREITLESLSLVRARRTEFHLFNEMLIQYRRGRGDVIGQVVPDNMVVRHEGALEVFGSYDVPLQPAGPFWVMEYVSKRSKRKDTEESFPKYERELKVPYLLHYFHDIGEMTLYRHNRRKYVTVKPNDAERFAIPEVEVELGLVEGWVRFWYQGELLPLPPELQQQNSALRAANARLTDRLCTAEQTIAELQAELARLRGRPAS